jgi:hypothetical protein
VDHQLVEYAVAIAPSCGEVTKRGAGAALVRYPDRAEWGGERFPPTVRPAPEDEARVRERWDEYGLGDL